MVRNILNTAGAQLQSQQYGYVAIDGLTHHWKATDHKLSTEQTADGHKKFPHRSFNAANASFHAHNLRTWGGQIIKTPAYKIGVVQYCACTQSNQAQPHSRWHQIQGIQNDSWWAYKLGRDPARINSLRRAFSSSSFFFSAALRGLIFRFSSSIHL